MRRTFCFAAAALLVTGAVFGQTIRVTLPVRGNVAMGSACAIAWTASSEITQVRIRLIKPDGTRIALLADDLAVGASPWSWIVATPAVVGESYKIHIKAIGYPVEDTSGTITVVAAGTEPEPSGTLANVRLGGASPYVIGQNVALSWTASGIAQNLKLQLTRSSGTPIGPIADSLAAGTTSYAWPAGQFIGGTAQAADNAYRIRVSTVDDSLSAESPVFSLATTLAPEPPGPRCDLQLNGVGVEYHNGQIVAWVKNNGPQALTRHAVRFRLNFVSLGGGERLLTQVMTIPVGEERSAEIQPLAAGEFPETGMRTTLYIDSDATGIQDANHLNQHRDVLLWPNGNPTAELAIMLYGSDWHMTRLVGQGTASFYRYRLRATLRLRNNSSTRAEIRDVLCSWELQHPNAMHPGGWAHSSGAAAGTLRLGPFRSGVYTPQEVTIDFLIHHNWVKSDNRIAFVLDPEHRHNDPDRRNNVAHTGAFRD